MRQMINKTWVLSTGFSKDILISNFIKKFDHSEQSYFTRVGGRVDGQTDVTKLIFAFRNFAKVPRNWRRCLNYNTLCVSNTIRFRQWSMTFRNIFLVGFDYCLKERHKRTVSINCLYFRPQTTRITKCTYTWAEASPFCVLHKDTV